MKRTLTIFLVCIVAYILVPFNAVGAGGPKPEPRPKATTIAELAERYDSSRCADCHEDAHDEWSESLHSKSILGSPRTAPTIITAIEKGLKLFPYSGVKEDADITVESLMMCMKCHLPQLDEATDDVAREIVATIRSWQQAYKDSDFDKVEELEETIASLNIGCAVCHNKVAIIHKYSDGYPQYDTIYGSQEGDHEDEEYVKMAEAPALGEASSAGSVMDRGQILNLIIHLSAPPLMAATSLPMLPMAVVNLARNAICISLSLDIICNPIRMRPWSRWHLT